MSNRRSSTRGGRVPRRLLSIPVVQPLIEFRHLTRAQRVVVRDPSPSPLDAFRHSLQLSEALSGDSAQLSSSRQASAFFSHNVARVRRPSLAPSTVVPSSSLLPFSRRASATDSSASSSVFGPPSGATLNYDASNELSVADEYELVAVKRSGAKAVSSSKSAALSGSEAVSSSKLLSGWSALSGSEAVSSYKSAALSGSVSSSKSVSGGWTGVPGAGPPDIQVDTTPDSGVTEELIRPQNALLLNSSVEEAVRWRATGATSCRREDDDSASDVFVSRLSEEEEEAAQQRYIVSWRHARAHPSITSWSPLVCSDACSRAAAAVTPSVAGPCDQSTCPPPANALDPSPQSSPLPTKSVTRLWHLICRRSRVVRRRTCPMSVIEPVSSSHAASGRQEAQPVRYALMSVKVASLGSCMLRNSPAVWHTAGELLPAVSFVVRKASVSPVSARDASPVQPAPTGRASASPVSAGHIRVSPLSAACALIWAASAFLHSPGSPASIRHAKYVSPPSALRNARMWPASAFLRAPASPAPARHTRVSRASAGHAPVSPTSARHATVTLPDLCAAPARVRVRLLERARRASVPLGASVTPPTTLPYRRPLMPLMPRRVATLPRILPPKVATRAQLTSPMLAAPPPSVSPKSTIFPVLTPPKEATLPPSMSPDRRRQFARPHFCSNYRKLATVDDSAFMSVERCTLHEGGTTVGPRRYGDTGGAFPSHHHRG